MVNNLDVQPFVMAVEKLQTFYLEKHIDIFKTAISVPGIARQMLFKGAREERAEFFLIDEKNKDLYQTIKDTIVGGKFSIENLVYYRTLKACLEFYEISLNSSRF